MIVFALFLITVVVCALYKIFVIDYVKKEMQQSESIDQNDCEFNVNWMNVIVYVAILIVSCAGLLSTCLILHHHIIK